MRLIDVAGKSIRVSGEESDPYFQDSQGHVNGFGRVWSALDKLPDEAVIVDVGANIGLWAMSAAILKPKSRIVCFEPSPINFRHLKANAERNNLNNIFCYDVAVSNSNAALRFRETRNGNWSGSWAHVVGKNYSGCQGDTVDVKSLRLDDIPGLNPDFIKIDVEGHEPEVLAGARGILEKFRPLIFLEFNPWTLNAYGGHSPAAFASALFDCFDVEGECRTSLDLLHVTLCKRGLTDLLMRPKSNVEMPAFQEMSYPPSALTEIDALRRGRELDSGSHYPKASRRVGAVYDESEDVLRSRPISLGLGHS